jgi:hypothetical protein
LTRGVRGAVCGRERRKERVERRGLGRGLVGRLGPNREYGTRLPHGTTWCEAFGVHANWGCRMHGRCGNRRA